MSRLYRPDEKPWVPKQVELLDPVDAPEDAPEPEDNNIHINTVPGEIELADNETLERVIEECGRVPYEPEIGRAVLLDKRPMQDEDDLLVGTTAYVDRHWTHFDYRPDVAKYVVRTQKKYPWLTYANTYFEHPPVYGRRYEFVSFDLWGGGVVNGRYVGYRGKPLYWTVDGWEVFNSLFADPYLPNIEWIIYNGHMWSRRYGWGPSPSGPPDSDPRHDKHIHLSGVL